MMATISVPDPIPASNPGPQSSSSALYTARVDNLGGTSGQVRVHEGPASPTPPPRWSTASSPRTSCRRTSCRQGRPRPPWYCSGAYPRFVDTGVFTLRALA